MQNIPTSIWSILAGLPLIPSSKSAAESWLSLAELSLVVFAFVIGLGLVAEDRAERNETKWIPAHPGWNWKRIFAWVVAGGVIAELFSDGAIWISSDALQTISDGEIAQLQPRRLSISEQTEIKNALAPFSGRRVSVVSYALDVESFVLATQLEKLLTPWILVTDSLGSVVLFGRPTEGINVRGPNEELAKAIVAALRDRGNLEAHFESPQRADTGSGIVTPPNDPRPTEATVFVGVKPLPK
jgi:hypothetical protein